MSPNSFFKDAIVSPFIIGDTNLIGTNLVTLISFETNGLNFVSIDYSNDIFLLCFNLSLQGNEKPSSSKDSLTTFLFDSLSYPFLPSKTQVKVVLNF